MVFFTAVFASGWSFPFPLATVAIGDFFSLRDFAFPLSFSTLNLSSITWKDRILLIKPYSEQAMAFLLSGKLNLYFIHSLLYSLIHSSSQDSGDSRLSLSCEKAHQTQRLEGWMLGDCHTHTHLSGREFILKEPPPPLGLINKLS